MKTTFFKYQGNGNDFIILDNREGSLNYAVPRIRKLCDRHFGIGADGLILLNGDNEVDFEMVYFNSDGNLSTMCGNGGRCIAAFAFRQGIAGERMSFRASDGIHRAVIEKEIKKDKEHYVALSMADVKGIEKDPGFYFINTGSPHYVEFVNKAAEIDVAAEGRKTRYSERFSPEGTNVNFVEINGDRLFVRTYERGVEDETLSCGTGVTASAVAAYLETGKKDYSIHTTGGDFQVSFEEENGYFSSLWLKGPAELVFEGRIDL